MIPNFKTITGGSVQCAYRGGQPDDAGWNQLEKLGVTRVIKLNTDGEGSDAAAEALGMELVYCPIPVVDQIVFRPNKQLVQQAVDAIQGNAFIHCTHGQDRTGLIVGLWRVQKCGWLKTEARAEMSAHGFHRELLGLEMFWEWSV